MRPQLLFICVFLDMDRHTHTDSIHKYKKRRDKVHFLHCICIYNPIFFPSNFEPIVYKFEIISRIVRQKWKQRRNENMDRILFYFLIKNSLAYAHKFRYKQKKKTQKILLAYKCVACVHVGSRLYINKYFQFFFFS